MASESMKAYRKDMALAVLARSLKPMTNGDIADTFAALAMSEGHPEACWRGVDASTINGYMQQMARAKLVAKDGEKHDGRAGRAVAMWSTALDSSESPIPFPPQRHEHVPREAPRAEVKQPDSEFEQHTRGELYALLEVHGDLSNMMFRHLREFSEWTERARQRLAAAGLDATGL